MTYDDDTIIAAAGWVAFFSTCPENRRASLKYVMHSAPQHRVETVAALVESYRDVATAQAAIEASGEPLHAIVQSAGVRILVELGRDVLQSVLRAVAPLAFADDILARSLAGRRPRGDG